MHTNIRTRLRTEQQKCTPGLPVNSVDFCCFVRPALALLQIREAHCYLGCCVTSNPSFCCPKRILIATSGLEFLSNNFGQVRRTLCSKTWSSVENYQVDNFSWIRLLFGLLFSTESSLLLIKQNPDYYFRFELFLGVC